MLPVDILSRSPQSQFYVVVARSVLRLDLARSGDVVVRLNASGTPSVRSRSCSCDTFAAICAKERFSLLIMTAATPAAVPEAHSLGCSRVTELVRNDCAIDLPATSRLGASVTVRARKGMK